MKNETELETEERYEEKYCKRKGGTAKSIQTLVLWCIIMSVILGSLCFVVARSIEKRKKNYTELHRMVSELTRRVEALEK